MKKIFLFRTIIWFLTFIIFSITCSVIAYKYNHNFVKPSVPHEKNKIEDYSLVRKDSRIFFTTPENIYKKNPRLDIQATEDKSRYFIGFYNIDDKDTCNNIKKAIFALGSEISIINMVDKANPSDVVNVKSSDVFNCDLVNGIYFSINKEKVVNE